MIRTGDPVVDYSQVKAGWFLQDDFRPSRTLQLSFGVRQEIQTQVDSRKSTWRRARRFTWNATRKTTVRGGYGIFYDWYDSATSTNRPFASTATTRSTWIVQNPGFPVTDATGTRLPASLIRARVAEVSRSFTRPRSGLERPLTGGRTCAPTTCGHAATDTLRSINVNAPVNGVRPDPAVGNITEIQSSRQARLGPRHGGAEHARYIAAAHPRHGDVPVWQFARTSPTCRHVAAVDSLNPDADWGPSAQDVRHRIFFNFNAPSSAAVCA